MNLEKHVIRFVNLLLVSFFAFGILAFLEQFANVGWPWFSRCTLCYPILIGFPLGLVARRLENLKFPLLGISCAIAAFLMVLLFPSYRFLDVLYLVAATVLAAVMFLIGLRGEEPFPPKLAVASLLVYVGSCVYFFVGDYVISDFMPLCWCALFSFTLSLYSFNAASLHIGVHNAKGGETMAIPSGIRGKNMLMLTLFLIVAMLIGSLGFLHRFLDGAWHWLLLSIGTFFRFMANLQGGGGDGTATPTPTPEETVEATVDISAMVEDGDSTFAVVYGILLGLCCVIFFLLAYGFARESKNGGHRLANWMRNLFKTREILEYEDDVERTAGLKDLLDEQRKKLRKRIRALRTRQETYEDMQTDRMRIRFVYRALLRSGRVGGWTPSATAKEVGSALETPQLRQLTEIYSTARYQSAEEPSAEEVAEAREALNLLQKRGGR